jgi:PTS system mannose-specific IIA component
VLVNEPRVDKIALLPPGQPESGRNKMRLKGHDGSQSRMIGLVLVTHGQLAEEFRNAVEHVVGTQEKFETVAIGADDNMEQRRQDIVEAVARADSGTGVVILTDMFGGTPSNLAISVMEPGHVEVIAGMNLPMLIKLSSVRSSDNMGAALADAQAAGRKYINVASQLLNSK